MSQLPQPERYLELFDELNLDNIEDRRTGYYLLHNYFSTVLTNTAEENLGAMASINQDRIHKQWSLVRDKLEEVPGQVPKELENTLTPIIEARNSIIHNDRCEPRQHIDDLQEIRDQAPEWRTEIEEMTEAYYRAWEDLSPKQALVTLVEQNLQRVLSSEPRFDRFDSEYSPIHEAAEESREILEQDVDPDRERIEKELVEVVRTAQGLTKKTEDLEKQEIEYEDYLMNEELDRMRGR
ncbi:hypothetical protein [Halopiger aswanensis]|uniref:Uncharacterized protein n=1 Tax=Halopiger aswanensis TaxID=148449 RepID=A0A419WJE2_9EURY|nr:hypothetical protein [Halopiger aswanensis]RKD95605.1 hypothetical protein ATJ93_2465 [Halopiger aswanensis]